MTLVAFLVLLGVLITVHELGHFIVAKLSGVKVLTFSIGFGPKLVGFTRGETEYRLSMLPLGGYVRMYGDDITSDVPPEERHRAFLEKPVPVKMAIAVAGPVANLLLPIALFFGLSVGHEQVIEPVVGTVVADSAAARAGLRPGDRVVAVDGERVQTFTELASAVSTRPGQETTLTIERTIDGAPQRLSLIGTPQSVAGPSGAPIGRLGFTSTRALPLVMAATKSPAANAGIKPGDRILQVNGVDVVDMDQVWAVLDRLPASADVVLTVERQKEREAAGGPGTFTDGAVAEGPAAGEKTTLTLTIPGAVVAPPPAPPQAPPPVVEIAVDDVVAQAEGSTEGPLEGAAEGAVEGAPPGGVESEGLARESPAAPTSAPTPAPIVPLAPLRFAVVNDELVGAVAEAQRRTETLAVDAAEAQRRRRGLASMEGVVRSVEPESPAALKGLLPQSHRVVAADGQAVTSAGGLSEILGENIDGIHALGLIDAAGAPQIFTLRLQPSSRRVMAEQKVLGVVLTSTQGFASIGEREVSVGQAAVKAVQATAGVVVAVVDGYVMLLTGKVGLNQLGGPIMLASIAGEAAENGLETFVGTMALLSVNLALLNLLPVPVLDGGHLLLFTIEGLRRRRLSVQARIRATKIGMIFVGALMVVALFNDLASVFS